MTFNKKEQDSASIYSTSSSVFSTSSKLTKIKTYFNKDKRISLNLFSFSKNKQQKQEFIIPKSTQQPPSISLNINSNLDLDFLSRKRSKSESQLFKGLITTTITTLHSRLINECDRILSMFILQSKDEAYLKQQILAVIKDVFRMVEMVSWENDEKMMIKNNLREISNNQDNIKQAILQLKQVMNICISTYYRLVERAMIIPAKGYKIETHSQRVDYTNYGIDHLDSNLHWYRTYFNHDDTLTYFGLDNQQEPALVSIDPHENRVIHRTKYRNEYIINECDTIKELIEANFDMNYTNLVKLNHEQLISSNLNDEILKLDENLIHKKYKFGILLIKDGQTKEEDWFSNEHTSPSFDRFLHIIGNKTALKDYQGWAAGLDTKSGDSGEFTFTNVWKDYMIAYHVSTLIPSNPSDKQQIKRKRHIGNDIVCIVFIEGDQPFNPSAIKSQFLHVFIVVKQEIVDTKIGWRVEVVSIDEVPKFGPPLPDPPLFFDESELSQYILVKLLNAEHAALKSPKFSMPMTRVRENMLTNLVESAYKHLNLDFQIKSTASNKNWWKKTPNKQ